MIKHCRPNVTDLQTNCPSAVVSKINHKMENTIFIINHKHEINLMRLKSQTGSSNTQFFHSAYTIKIQVLKFWASSIFGDHNSKCASRISFSSALRNREFLTIEASALYWIDKYSLVLGIPLEMILKSIIGKKCRFFVFALPFSLFFLSSNEQHNLFLFDKVNISIRHERRLDCW